MIPFPGLIAIGTAVLLGFGALQTVRVRSAQAEVREVRAELVQAEARLDALGAQLDRQNAAVADWQKLASAAAQAGRRAREEVGRVVAEHRRSADALAAAVAAPAGGMTCSDAATVVRADLGGSSLR